MTALGMAVLGLVLLAWGAYLYRSSNLLERVRHQRLGQSKLFQILLELIVLGTFPEGLTLVVAGSAQALGADVVALFAYIVGNLTVLALWLTRPNWAKPHWMRDATAERPS